MPLMEYEEDKEMLILKDELTRCAAWIMDSHQNRSSTGPTPV